MSSSRFSLPSLCLTLIIGMTLLMPSLAKADVDSYYAPPSQIHSTIQLGYSETFSQDYINLNTNPLARFTNSTAGFHFHREKNTLSHLRASISTGSVTSPDKDFTWILLSQTGLNINQYDEIVLLSNQQAVFDKDNKAILDGFFILRGITAPVKIEAKLNFVQESGFLKSSVLGDKSSIGLSLSVSYKCEDFGMAPVDSNNKSRGDIATVKMEMRAIKQ